MTLHCLWCQKAYEPRRDGGRHQRFCSTQCRRDLDKAARNWVASMLQQGLVSVAYLQECLSNNARVAYSAILPPSATQPPTDQETHHGEPETSEPR
jgi:hypothetical protein